ncbi:uncharacterized protein LOC125663998 [Ostrea edulis]|uniref:uncharacterized protein LOC125663998 n=1 Tax=Ostrea edulis TaxID=37623 RepID=UPI0024AFA9A3|nr:uncharacterized protein LOC125663998 [Ostrea edulis]
MDPTCCSKMDTSREEKKRSPKRDMEENSRKRDEGTRIDLGKNKDLVSRQSILEVSSGSLMCKPARRGLNIPNGSSIKHSTKPKRKRTRIRKQHHIRPQLFKSRNSNVQISTVYQRKIWQNRNTLFHTRTMKRWTTAASVLYFMIFRNHQSLDQQNFILLCL